MTKKKALKLITNYLLNVGKEPAKNAVLFSEMQGNTLSQWTYQGLKELLLK
jgi:hypothetical protein